MAKENHEPTLKDIFDNAEENSDNEIRNNLEYTVKEYEKKDEKECPRNREDLEAFIAHIEGEYGEKFAGSKMTKEEQEHLLEIMHSELESIRKGFLEYIDAKAKLEKLQK